MEIFIDSFFNLFAGPTLGGIFPLRFLYLVLGALLGLFIGVLPGLGGVVGLALLLPFTFNMDPYMAFAMMVAMTAVTTTSDTIPAVFFNVPGSVGSAATILDGHPMAKKGEAGRALGAAYTASLMGGVIGALFLFLCYTDSPPYIDALCCSGISDVSSIRPRSCGFLNRRRAGERIAGSGPGSYYRFDWHGTFQWHSTWTFGELYLWDGISVAVVGLGLFAIPEIIDMVISGKSIAPPDTKNSKGGVVQGIIDVFKNWFLILALGLLGAFLGALPGIGVSLINWLAYGHALQTEKGARESFGKGDVRGVIAPESSNNAKEDSFSYSCFWNPW